MISKYNNFESMSEKRAFLKGISQDFQKAIKAGLIPKAKINTLIESYYKQQCGINEFHSFKGWKDKGYNVKKGEKAFVIWGQPRTGTTDKEEEGNEELVADEFSYFPVAYIFADCQVQAKA